MPAQPARPRPDPRVALLAELADATRFAILERLERGPASATELARALEISPTQLANHLRRLRDAELVAVRRRGRLAIYTLAEPGLREIFSMVNGLRGARLPATPARPVLEAGTCYDHLAGELGVSLLDHLIGRGALLARDGEGELELGPRAVDGFAELGVSQTDRATRRMSAFACLDSGLRRPHLGGELGARLAASLRDRGWLRESGRPRELDVTPEGRAQLRRLGALP